MNWIESVIVGIIEGLTEFIPVSSTGHMIITEKLLHIPDNDFTKMFTVAIQLGAILAVVVLYRKKFFDFKNIRFYKKLFIGVLPIMILGLSFEKKIDELLESTTTVASTILLGGIVLLFIDKLFLQTPIDKSKETTFRNAIIIGFWQCLAMIPGVSRSAASIIGGMQQKLSRSAAAEFSFFLAVPTMLAATGYKLYKYYTERGGFEQDEIQILALGNLVAFIVAVIAIKFFIGFLKKHGFRFWGYYRITLGILLFVLMYFGYIDK